MSGATKHTPGPWFVPYRAHGTLFVEAHLRQGWLQEVAACGPTEIGSQQEANARLIAAAPELLEALQFVMSAHGEQLDLAFQQAQDAIAKATGGAQ